MSDTRGTEETIMKSKGGAELRRVPDVGTTKGYVYIITVKGVEVNRTTEFINAYFTYSTHIQG